MALELLELDELKHIEWHASNDLLCSFDRTFLGNINTLLIQASPQGRKSLGSRNCSTDKKLWEITSDLRAFLEEKIFCYLRTSDFFFFLNDTSSVMERSEWDVCAHCIGCYFWRKKKIWKKKKLKGFCTKWNKTTNCYHLQLSNQGVTF